MSANTLSVEVQPEVPNTFIRGQTLEFIMELPCDVPADYFHKSDPTANPPTLTDTVVTSELRQKQNAGAGGFIAQLDVDWEDPVTNGYTKLRFHADPTDDWPLGVAEFDVVFTRTVTNTNTQTIISTRTIRSKPVYITIVDGVTA